MRNTDKYPITLDEVIGCLHRLKLEAMAECVDQMSTGDMTPLFLEHAIKILHRERILHGG